MTPAEIAALRSLLEKATPIPGFQGYAVTRCGRVLSFKQHKPLEMALCPNKPGGYLRANLRANGRNKHVHVMVHRLVAMTFLRAPIAGEQARHLDGNRLNNRVENLAWGSKRENEADKVLHGTDNRGARSGSCKLTEDVVRDIRSRLAVGEAGADIARDCKVDRVTVYRIRDRRTWKHTT